MMTDPIRILHLEDSPYDAELAAAVLAADGQAADILRVETADAFTHALRVERIDAILADFSLPQFDGLVAQRLAAELRPDVPFIFLSGSLGEEVAIERLKAGATDYVLKERITRLASSVRRALAEAAERAERRRAESEIRRLNAELEQRVRDATSVLEDLIASSPSMVFRLDPQDLRITYASPNVGWVLGYSFDEVSVDGFWEAHLHKDDRERIPRETRAALDNHVVQIEQEYRLCCQDSRYRWFFGLMRVEYDASGAPIAVLRYCLDIADRKAAEQAATAAKIEAERANAAKSDFLSRMSHDLRTPLNAILGFAQLLDAEALGPEGRESVQLILKGGEHLLGLINEVLDIARIEAGHLSLSPEPVDVQEIVRHAVALVAPLAAQRAITIVVPDSTCAPWAVMADRQRLNQVLLNLLSNAVKYNRHGGRIVVTCEDQPDRRLRITVTDTGAGIPADKLEMLFTPFERLGADTTAIEGTGLGLVLSRGLAEAMGGSLGVSSEVDRGTTFWIELAISDQPVAPVPMDAAAAPTTDAGGVAGTVLYIEDNAANVRLMERVFQRRPGVTLHHASSGSDGLAMAAREKPDLIFLDLHLPDLHGEEVLRQLWQDPVLRGIPVTILSADASPTQARRLKAAGAVGYLTKPLNVAEVLRLLDDSLHNKHEVPHGLGT